MADKTSTPAPVSNAPEEKRGGFTRRGFLRGAGISAVAAAVAETGLSQLAKGQAAAPDAAALNTPISGEIKITLNINGQARDVTVEPRTTLLSAIRDRLEPALMGPKLVCNAGTCGACTCIVDGNNVYGCSQLAIDMIGRKITTVEGIGTPTNMSPVQKAMMATDGMMCGFRTVGFVTSMTAFLGKNPNPNLDQIKQGLKGNFCRCGTYPHVFEATLAAAKSMKA